MRAKNNRTLFLEEGDVRRFTAMPLEKLKSSLAGGGFESALDNLFLGDALQGLSLLPAGTVQLVFLDPPYNNGRARGDGTQKRMSAIEYAKWLEEIIVESKRLLSENGSIYLCCDWLHSALCYNILSKHFKVKNRITWRREKGRGAERNWKNNMEDIWFAVKSERYTFNLAAVKVKKEVIAPYRENGVPKDWYESSEGKIRLTHPPNIWVDTVVPFWSMYENTPHPTQKPELVLERILLASTQEGEVVCDPFIGSGTTAVVALRLNRRFIGFEHNAEYAALANKRIKERCNPQEIIRNKRFAKSANEK